MRRIDLRISEAGKRLADTYYQKRAEEIDRQYEHIRVNPLTFHSMRAEDKDAYLRIYYGWAEGKVQARFETYRDAFRREGVIPDEADLSNMSWAFDAIVSNLSPAVPEEAQQILNQIGRRIINDARRDIQILINEMRYEQLQARNREPSSVQYNIHINENRGPIQQGGSGNMQSISRDDDEAK